MSITQAAPCGSWRSPVTSGLIASANIGLGEILLDGHDVYWIEMRPAEKGRQVVVKLGPDGQPVDVVPAPYNARTRVHEYGGGAFVTAPGAVYFSNFDDQRIHGLTPGRPPRPLTPPGDFCYADAVVDLAGKRMICVREDRSHGTKEPVNSLVTVDLDGKGQVGLLVTGKDFFASPRISPDRTQLAWLAWDHPNMPWDGTELWVADLKGHGSTGPHRLVAGGREESIFQPEWSPDGVLHFVSDRSGWWNLYRFRDGEVEPLTFLEAECGMPQWVFRMSTYAFTTAHRIACAHTYGGRWHLAMLDTRSRTLEAVETPYTDIASVRASPGRIVFLGASPVDSACVVQLDLYTGQSAVLRRSSTFPVSQDYIALPEAIAFPTENGVTAHGLYYGPRNPDYTLPPGERPPLLVVSHGGPTSAVRTELNWTIQFWTSRGFAVLAVNYRGSTGYGRAYRKRLEGNWGVVDVDDCVNGALHLAERGLVDPDRLAIRGSSAGGYTTLCALVLRNVFKAGASYYGVSDLEALAKETHKFESRYLDRLIGPYPQARPLYLERSPIHHVDRLSCPVIFLQGLEDRVVPPDQARKMFEALCAKGVPTAYVTFPEEQHGFRRAESIQRALDAELYFYSRVFGFQPQDALEPLQIENL